MFPQLSQRNGGRETTHEFAQIGRPESFNMGHQPEAPCAKLNFKNQSNSFKNQGNSFGPTVFHPYRKA